MGEIERNVDFSGTGEVSCLFTFAAVLIVKQSATIKNGY